jgi:cobalt/nickel transport system permease protein
MKHDYLDKYSGLDSVLRRLDPRTKIFAFFSAIVIIVSEPKGELFPFIFYSVALGSLIMAGRIPLKFVLSRCLIASPFILMAALLLPLSLLFSGPIKSDVFSVNMAALSGSILLKAYSALILVVLLTSTDKFHRLLKGLRSLGMPSVLGAMSALMYRYIFILNDERLRTNRARESRTPGRLKISRFKVLGHQAAMIFLRSWDRAHTVYQSMLSRGFDGSFPEFEGLAFHRRDLVFIIGFFIIMSVIRIYA